MYSFEVAWLREILLSILPSGTSSSPPSLADVMSAIEQEGFFQALERDSPPFFRLGIRASIWSVQLSPILVLGRPRLFLSLDTSAREDCLRRLLVHRSMIVRQIVMVLRLIASFAYFRSSAARRWFDEDRA